MLSQIKSAISQSVHENRTVHTELDRRGMDDAAIAAEVHVIWRKLCDDSQYESDDSADTDWESDKDGGVRVWGWSDGQAEPWTIVIA